MYPPAIAETDPDALAYLMAGSGERLTFAELDARSNALAHLLRRHGVEAGDTLVLLLPNHLAWPVAVAAGMRTGLLVTPVNWHLGATELAAILHEAGPAVVLTDAALAPTVLDALATMPPARAGRPALVLTVDEGPAGTEHLASALDGLPTTPVDGELLGARVLFSGRTTGRPRAFRQPLLGIHPTQAPARHPHLAQRLGIGPGIRFLSPAPNYHAAPFTFQLMVLGAGASVVCLERFEAGAALRALTEHEPTHSQWVPTMLSRLLAAPEREVWTPPASHRVAVTSGAPCPPELKDAINDWWGDILHEYYGASEGYGHTYVSPEESRTHRGTVGRPLGTARVRILDPLGEDLPAGAVGRVCFEQPGAEGVTRARGMGDLGHLDEDGFLHLSGRETFMVISGGVNIHPEEIELALATHPWVHDVSVFGVPHPDLGEQVVAVVEAAPGAPEAEALETALKEHCHDRLARYKTPREFAFVDTLPRLPTGKLNKTALRARRLAGEI